MGITLSAQVEGFWLGLACGEWYCLQPLHPQQPTPDLPLTLALIQQARAILASEAGWLRGLELGTPLGAKTLWSVALLTWLHPGGEQGLLDWLTQRHPPQVEKEQWASAWVLMQLTQSLLRPPVDLYVPLTDWLTAPVLQGSEMVEMLRQLQAGRRDRRSLAEVNLALTPLPQSRDDLETAQAVAQLIAVLIWTAEDPLLGLRCGYQLRPESWFMALLGALLGLRCGVGSLPLSRMMSLRQSTGLGEASEPFSQVLAAVAHQCLAQWAGVLDPTQLHDGSAWAQMAIAPAGELRPRN